jgi:rhamnogalacturonyl hydrolase YesR
MGLTRCLEAAQTHGLDLPDDLLDELNNVLSWLLAQQRTDGLWSNFIDEQAQAPDTSGSAGIATAMTLASHYGWLDDVTGVSFQQAASHTFDTLLHYLTADGYLTGVAPNNKGEGGITLQRQPYRATMQFATGLMGSLLAAQRKAGMASTDMLD